MYCTVRLTGPSLVEQQVEWSLTYHVDCCSCCKMSDPAKTYGSHLTRLPCCTYLLTDVPCCIPAAARLFSQPPNPDLAKTLKYTHYLTITRHLTLPYLTLHTSPIESHGTGYRTKDTGEKSHGDNTGRDSSYVPYSTAQLCTTRSTGQDRTVAAR